MKTNPKNRLPCPFCGSRDNHVENSRLSTETSRRRRYICYGCGCHFGTLEIPVETGSGGQISLEQVLKRRLLGEASAEDLLNALKRRLEVQNVRAE